MLLDHDAGDRVAAGGEALGEPTQVLAQRLGLDPHEVGEIGVVTAEHGRHSVGMAGLFELAAGLGARALLAEACPEFAADAVPSDWFEPARNGGRLAVAAA